MLLCSQFIIGGCATHPKRGLKNQLLFPLSSINAFSSPASFQILKRRAHILPSFTKGFLPLYDHNNLFPHNLQNSYCCQKS